MIMTLSERFLKARDVFEQVLKLVEQAGQQDQRVDLLERNVFAALLQIGFELLEGYIARCGDGDQGEKLEQAGRTLRRLEEQRERRYVSIFGEHRFDRYVYAMREGRKIQRRPGMPRRFA